MSISVGSVAVDVVPSTKGFAEELKAKLKGITANIGVDADLTALRAKLDEATRTRTATINVNADTGAAEAKLDAAARNRTSTIKANGLSNIFSEFSGISALVVGLGPALIPVVAAFGGLAAVLAAPLAAAGGGLTIGALIAGAAIKQTETQKKKIDELAKRVTAAKQNLANVQASSAGSAAISTTSAQAAAQRRIAAAQAALNGAKSPAAAAAAERQLATARASLATSLATTQARSSLQVANAQRKVTEATVAYDVAAKGLTPAQARFLEAQKALKDSFKGLVASAGPAIFGPVIKGMDLLAKVLPKLKPLIVPVAKAVGSLLDELGKAASGPGFKAFIKSFGSEAGAAIVAFGHMFADFGKGLFGLFRAFSPASKGFVSGLSGTAKAFANWSASLGSSKSFQAFLAYVKDVGPKVAAALGHTVEAIGKLAGVLAPLGALSLAAIDTLAKFINNASPAQIALIAGSIGGLAIAVAALGGPAVAIPAAILAVGGALAFAYAHSKKFRDSLSGAGKIVGELGTFFKERLLPALERAGRTVLPGLKSAFDSIKKSISDNHGLFKVLGDTLVNVVIPAVAIFYSNYLPILGKAIGLAITGIRLLAVGFTYLATAGLESFKALAVGAFATFGAILDAADKGLGWMGSFGKKIHAAKLGFDQFRDNTVAALDVAIGKVADLRNELNSLKPKTIWVKVKFNGTGPLKPTSPLFGPGISPEGAGARGAIINRPTVLLAGESGPERLQPIDQTPGNAPLPSGGGSAPMFNVEKVYAQDVNDFLRQMQTRSRLAGLSGGRA